ncbi:MAG: biotin--[acetyl-CoA-carboxylase] ligase [Gemmatimonadales bacterium]
MAPRQPPVITLERLDRAESTQDLIHRKAEEGAPHGTAIVAREQSGARGTRGRKWHAPIGGLWMSVLCRPEVAAAAEVLSLRAGLAVAAALEGAGKLPLIGLKWPNDLILGDRKVAGILCEARWRGDQIAWVTVGIGINVTNPVPGAVAATATRLADYDSTLDAGALAETIAVAIAEAGSGGPTLSGAELQAFGRRDWLRGKRLTEPEPGTAGGVADDGTLIVYADDGTTRTVRAGSIVLENGS